MILLQVRDRATVVSSLFGSVSKDNRDRDQNVVQTLRDRQHLHKILERKAELAVRGEKLAQQRLFETEADVEVKHWEKRISDIAQSGIGVPTISATTGESTG